VLASLPREQQQRATATLIAAMFFSGRPRFFNYTHSASELSLMLDVSTLSLFPPDLLVLGAGEWSILEIIEGSEIIDVSGVVASLCAPLIADRRVEELLYLSTFVSDLILVRGHHVEAAEQTLSNNLQYLIESRRRAAEALAKAEMEERERAEKQRLMEEEDRRRAMERSEEEERVEREAEEKEEMERDGIHVDGASPSSNPIPIPSVGSQSPASIASTAETDMFPLSIASSASAMAAKEAAHAAQHAQSPHQPLATISSLQLGSPIESTHAPFQSPHHSDFQATRTRFQSTAGSGSVMDASVTSNLLQRLHLEGEDGEAEAESDAIAMNLSRLPFRLCLLTFHARHLPLCMHAIMQVLLMPGKSGSTPYDQSSPSSASSLLPTCLQPNFFSFTQAGDQISLIVETDAVSLFPSHIVSQHKLVWNAIQVSQGSESLDTAGLVAPLSVILASVNVSIYYLSTYNLDFILVAENQVHIAIDTLKQRMNVLVDGE